MESQTKTQLVRNFTHDIRNPKKYNLHHYLQRKEDQWTKPQKSLLIDSIFCDIRILPICASIEDGIRYVFDGIQRGTTLAEYMEDKFAISKNNPPVLVDNVPYETAGKKFSQLDQVLQDKISNYEITLYLYTDATDDDVRKIYSRLNNGKPLTSTQKRTAIEPKAVSNIVFPISEHPFFEKVLTKVNLKSDINRDLVRETLMLLNSNDEHDFTRFNQKGIDNFVLWYGDNINESDRTNIVDTLDLLDEKIDEIKIKHPSIPMLLYAGVQCQREGKDFDKFIEAVKRFAESYENDEEYKKFCTGGTTSSYAVNGRLDYWKNICNNL